MDPRPARGSRRSFGSPALVVLALLAHVTVHACGSPPPSSAPVGARPAIQVDQTWTQTGGEWTFTGRVDPQGDATDVVLEIGPGPATARQFDTELPVAQDITAAAPLTITTPEIPDIEEICVRFTATNSVGTSWSTPLCFLHDMPTAAPPTAPVVNIDDHWTAANGEWTFTGRVDPARDPTDVVLEIGPGPAAAGQFDTEVPVAQDLTDAATLTVTTQEIPDVDEICVRFTATNSLGTSSSTPLCFPQGLPSVSPGDSATPP